MIDVYTWPLEVPAEHRRAGQHSDKEREILFGKTQYAKR
jgi:hypothetical protein